MLKNMTKKGEEFTEKFNKFSVNWNILGRNNEKAAEILFLIFIITTLFP